jgi:hypothetical protein
MPRTTRLTRPQLIELKEQSRKEQPTFGCHRTKVQRRLVEMGLSRWGANEDGDVCRITEAGLAAVAREATKALVTQPEKIGCPCCDSEDEPAEGCTCAPGCPNS